MQGRLPVTNLQGSSTRVRRLSILIGCEPRRSVEIRKHPMGPVPKWGLYFYWGRGITRVVFNRPLYPAHVDASDSEFQKLLLVSGLVLSWRAFPQRMIPLSCGCSHNPFFFIEIKA